MPGKTLGRIATTLKVFAWIEAGIAAICAISLGNDFRYFFFFVIFGFLGFLILCAIAESIYLFIDIGHNVRRLVELNEKKQLG